MYAWKGKHSDDLVWLSIIVSDLERKPLIVSSIPVTDSFHVRGPESKRLVSGAEVSAAVLHQDPLDSAAANGAGFASSMSNLKIEMGCAQLALGADAGIHADASEGGRELSRISQMRHRSF